ncbi:MAG: hypothetical protein RPU39_13810 [Candidatus Sedimenticola sp. (ex Thyasira tokunagai)]
MFKWIFLGAAVASVAWSSWLFRFEPIGKEAILDRWTGDVVLYWGLHEEGERIDLSVKRPAETKPTTGILRPSAEDFLK